jgi:Lar family restriction alleviation protein
MKIPSEAGHKPCPFCNSTEAFLHLHERAEKYWVTCAICGATGPWARSPSSALSRWNERLGVAQDAR